ncbi:putative glucooligosaccharide oxidase [Hypoxylon sp. FL1284]|nr:putative glucooligosaccharide oxidase [Hypoxylon sp. FL1284]
MDPTRYSCLVNNLALELEEGEIRFKTHDDEDWGEWAATYNLRVPVTPAVIAIPRDLLEVQAAIKIARRFGVKVQARSGGHSYASHSNGGVDGAMVLNLRKFAIVNPCGGETLVMAGVRLGNMAQRFFELTNSALPHGTCAGVGVGGHLAHGGFGFFSRAWGLAMDRIVEMVAITADSKSRVLSETENSDLFYAMRGAADSFGIAIGFSLLPVEAPRSVVHWDINLPGVFGHVDSWVKAFQHLQDFVHDESVVNRQLGLSVYIDGISFIIRGTYLGPVENLRGIIHSLLPSLELVARLEGSEPAISIKELSWLESLRALNQGESIEVDSWTEEKHDYFFAKSVVVTEPGFTEEALRSFFEYLADTENSMWMGTYVLINLWGGADSQINTTDGKSSAFGHRDACWVVQAHSSFSEWRKPETYINYITELISSMTKHLPRFGAYSGYADPSLTRAEAHKLYYSEETLAKLKQLKKKWDPDNVFSNPHSILPAEDEP